MWQVHAPRWRQKAEAGGWGCMHAESQHQAQEAGRPPPGPNLHSCTWQELWPACMPAGQATPCYVHTRTLDTHTTTVHITTTHTPCTARVSCTHCPKTLGRLHVSWQLSARQRDRLAGAHSQGVHRGPHTQSKLSSHRCAAPREAVHDSPVGAALRWRQLAVLLTAAPHTAQCQKQHANCQCQTSSFVYGLQKPSTQGFCVPPRLCFTPQDAWGVPCVLVDACGCQTGT